MYYTLLSFFRALCAGVTPLLVKMEVLVGSRELLTPASVRLDGLACTVTSPVCLAKLLPNDKVHGLRLKSNTGMGVESSLINFCCSWL